MNSSSFHKLSLKDECYMNLPALSYYTEYYKNVSDTELIDVFAYIYDITSNAYIIRPVSIIRDMLDNAPTQQKIIINKEEWDVWKIPCKIYNINNDDHIEAIKLLSVNIKKFNNFPLKAMKQAIAAKELKEKQHMNDYKIEEPMKAPHTIFLQAGKQMSMKKIKKMKRNIKTLKRK
uniref:Uncharacterized protein n=1 Tax=viral metagenome TaxID=1070528 RepID=A0A6C0IJ08_9ZZZZ